MEKIKVYLNEASNGFLVCKNCGKSKQINFSNREVPRSGLVKCSCSNTFAVLFEKRQHYRKQINAHGTCFEGGDSTIGTPVKIVDISRGGIHFLKIGGKPLQLNQTVRVVFPLGEQIINCIVSVYHVHNERVGGKVISMDEHSKKALGFFLLP